MNQLFLLLIISLFLILYIHNNESFISKKSSRVFLLNNSNTLHFTYNLGEFKKLLRNTNNIKKCKKCMHLPKCLETNNLLCKNDDSSYNTAHILSGCDAAKKYYIKRHDNVLTELTINIAKSCDNSIIIVDLEPTILQKNKHLENCFSLLENNLNRKTDGLYSCKTKWQKALFHKFNDERLCKIIEKLSNTEESNRPDLIIFKNNFCILGELSCGLYQKKTKIDRYDTLLKTILKIKDIKYIYKVNITVGANGSISKDDNNIDKLFKLINSKINVTQLKQTLMNICAVESFVMWKDFFNLELP